MIGSSDDFPAGADSSATGTRENGRASEETEWATGIELDDINYLTTTPILIVDGVGSMTRRGRKVKPNSNVLARVV